MNLVTAATDFEGQLACQTFFRDQIRNLHCPFFGFSPARKEIVVLKQKDRNASILMKIEHLVDDRAWCAQTTQWTTLLFIKRSNTAERTIPRTPATAENRRRRGCPWDCSFCSIRPFYEEQGGPLRRLRTPRAVVDEMLDLHQNRGVPIFLFQDDDFLAGGKTAKMWAMEIADLIVQAGLAGKLAFKISCRSDEIHEDVVERLIAGGLTHVYMGVESGDEEGLINMSKRLKPEAHLRAGRILKSFNLSFDFGFMLVDPYSTFRSIRQQI